MSMRMNIEQIIITLPSDKKALEVGITLIKTHYLWVAIFLSAVVLLPKVEGR